MLKGRSFPGKVLLTRRSEPLSPPEYSPRSENDRYDYEQNDGSQEVFWHFVGVVFSMSILQIVTDEILYLQAEGQTSGNTTDNISSKKSISPSTSSVNSLPDAQGIVSGARATDSARITKFTTELSRPAVILGMHIFYIGLWTIQSAVGCARIECGIKHGSYFLVKKIIIW
jgi:hypothetical protein